MKPDAFVQGHGGVISAGILIGLNQPSATPLLLQTPDGKLGVSISGNADQVTLNFMNNTGGGLDGVATDSSLTRVEVRIRVATLHLAERGTIRVTAQAVIREAPAPEPKAAGRGKRPGR
jgi:hypothetical protein